MANTFELINSTTLSSSAATVSFTGIPSTYKDLILRISARTDYGATRTGGKMTVNNDTGAYYDWGYWIQYNTNIEATSPYNTGNTYMSIEYLNGTGATANTFGITEIYMGSYASTTTNRPMSMHSAAIGNDAFASGQYLYNMSYNGTNAISSIQLTANTGNWVTNSSFYLYGIKNT